MNEGRHIGFILTLLLAVTAGPSHAQSALPDGKVAGKCMYTIFVELQLARESCSIAAAALDREIDRAIPQIEAHLVAVGELDARQVEQHRILTQSMWDPDNGAEWLVPMCASTKQMRSVITVDYVQRGTEQILAADVGDFSGDCI